MKLYIIGRVASGKTTLACKISVMTGTHVYHLDDIVHQAAPAGNGNIKRSVIEREQFFQEILMQESYIIEDVGRKCFTQGLREVDTVVLLDLPQKLLKKRIILRFIKQKLHIEKSSYRPSLQMLRAMFTWLKESPREKVKDLPNLVVLKNKKEIKNFLKNF
ncbi:hypothetical protein ACFO26_01830 [Lactococcus nasutitermitis]|uniref:DNA topology modulation protein FLAR-related protein n=1 Tax=Lactococcus nasutitermitis TaxID=1652957 RepID=A0ABV9JDT7_9LACT|nr:hypothetical protein [Lactococcus nasutitermitis]